MRQVQAILAADGHLRTEGRGTGHGDTDVAADGVVTGPERDAQFGVSNERRDRGKGVRESTLKVQLAESVNESETPDG